MEHEDIEGDNTFFEIIILWIAFAIIVIYFIITAPFRFIKNKFLKK